MNKQQALVNIKVEVDPEGLQRLIKEGKLVTFVDTLPAMMSGNVKAQIVEQLVASAGSATGAAMVFEDDDFGTPPPGPWPGPWAEVGIPMVTMMSETVNKLGRK